MNPNNTVSYTRTHTRPHAQVVSCTPDTPALDAMRLMVAAGVSSLAVVAEPEPWSEDEGEGEGEGEAGAAGAEGGPGAAGEGGRRGVSGGGRLLGNFSASEMR